MLYGGINVNFVLIPDCWGIPVIFHQLFNVSCLIEIKGLYQAKRSGFLVQTSKHFVGSCCWIIY